MQVRLDSLSKEAKTARKPQSVEELVDALQDPIHQDVGRSRSVKTSRVQTIKDKVDSKGSEEVIGVDNAS